MTTVFGFIRQAVLVVFLVGASAYAWYIYTPCHVPIRYSVGVVDERFGISKQKLLDAIAKAAAIWEEPAGEDLFTYQAEPPAITALNYLPINLIYDSRQQTTQKNNELKNQVAETTDTAESLKSQYEAAQERYKNLESEYYAAQGAYADKLAAYNAKVAYWNARGGAPTSEYKSLQAQKDALAKDATALEGKRVVLNAQGNTVNALSGRYNQLATRVNATVDVINQSAGREFEEGLYTRTALGTRIDVFEYSSEDKLVRVLAHELGHALGLEHNDNPDSIMYALNQSDNSTPTKEDVADLKLRCGIN